MSRIIINQGLDNEIVIPMSEFIEGLMGSMERKTPKEQLREQLLEFKETADFNLERYSKMKEGDLKKLWMRTEKLYIAFLIFVLNRNLEMSLHKKEKLELLSHPYLERVLEEEGFIPRDLTVQIDNDEVVSKEGLMVHIANQLKTQLENMKQILRDCEEFGWWP